MLFLHTATILALFSTLASASGPCTGSSAISWPPVGDCSVPGKYDTAVENCRACAMNDAPAFQACLKAAGIGSRKTIGEMALGVVPKARGLGRRAVDLTCEVNEGCYQYTDGSLLCLSLGTGLYHDDVGGSGDYYSGIYTGPDGKVQTGTSTATATAISGARSTSSISGGTGSTARAQTTSAVATSAPANSAASAPTSSAAAPAMAQIGNYRITNAGIIGLVVRLAL